MTAGVTVIACRPVTPSEVEQIVEIDMGQSMSAPYAGSIKGVCADCQRDVWIGPRQQEFIATHSDTTVIIRLCLMCSIQVSREVGPEEVVVSSLGNPEQPNNKT